MKENETPIPYVKHWSVGGIYKKLDMLEAQKEKGSLDWPPFCPIPLRLVYDPVKSCFPDWGKYNAATKNGVINAIAACWSWAKNKIVYHFDVELLQMLAEQAEKAENAEIPAEILVNLPYPCIFITAPLTVEGENYANGFFAWVDDNKESKTKDLHFYIGDTKSGRGFSSYLQLHTGKTIRECIDLTISFLRENDAFYKEMDYVEKEWAFHRNAIQWILYLLSENAEITSGPAPELDNTQKSQKGKKKKSSVKVKNVGFRIGAAIRKIKAQPSPSAETEPGTGSKKSPHSRRGHWHHFWTGPRDGERKLILKWVAPTFINLKNKTQDTVVVYPVKMRKEEKQ